MSNRPPSGDSGTPEVPVNAVAMSVTAPGQAPTGQRTVEGSSESEHSTRLPRRPFLRGASRRQALVLLEILVGFGICIAGFKYLIDPIRDLEIATVVFLSRLVGPDGVSGVIDNSIIIVMPDGTPIIASFTPSCSALLAILALAALAVTVMRGRRGHTLVAFLAAATVVFLANAIRIVLIVLAGQYFGEGALVMFHDWVGTILNFVYTFAGLLLMIHITLPHADRAEQDKSGRHTARRPNSWARQGLGYRIEEEVRRSTPSRNVMSIISRTMPTKVSNRLAAKREANRVDYRLGHMEPAARILQIRQLADDGLATHAATLLAVASYDENPMVLDTLAEVVASRQWEPVTSEKITALRLWARAWTLRPTVETVQVPQQRVPASTRAIAVTGAGGPAGVTVIRALAARGYAVIALDVDPSAVGFKLATQGIQVPAAEQEGFADAVLEAVRTHRVQAIICTVAEEYSALIAIEEKLHELGCKTWLPTAEAAKICNDKVLFAERLTVTEVEHPITATDESDLATVPGPWIIKPRHGRGSRGVVEVHDIADLFHTFRSVKGAICQTKIEGLEFTADALVDRRGKLVTCVPRWRSEVKSGISIKGETFDSAEVTAAVEDTLSAVGLTGPANVQGFVGEDGKVTIIEVNPRFSGGLPLTLAAGADVVGAYVAGLLDRAAVLPELTFVPGTSMSRHYAEVFHSPKGHRIPDPLATAATAPAARGTFAATDISAMV